MQSSRRLGATERCESEPDRGGRRSGGSGRSSGEPVPKRRGVTLIELLIVILIIMMITAFSIPVIAPAIQGRRVREGARMFSTFLNAARNRAIETKRPAGVWLERMPVYPEAVQNIFMAEVPPAYGGDFQDSRCIDVVCNKSGQCAFKPGGVRYPNHTDQDWWNIVIPRTRSTIMADIWSNPDPTEQNVVREGDQIQFEGTEYRYTLRPIKMTVDGFDGAGGSKLWWYILRGRNCGGNAEAGYDNVRHTDLTWRINWFDGRIHHGGTDSPHATASAVNDFSAVGRRYQIFRQPTKMSTGGIQLPEGVVLDLNFSGMSDGTLVANSTVNNSADSQFLGSMPFHPHRDPGDATLNPYWGDPIYPDDRTPVLIVFGSGGNVDRMYCQSYVWSRTQFSWQGINPWGPIFLLVGKLDKVFPHEVHRVNTPAEDAFTMQAKKNWQDFENLWVTIDPLTGLITTSIVDDVADTGNDPGLIADPANVRWARMSAARTRRNAGGR
jgi:type II secretory pathway pseudopilin PulG